MEFSVKPINFFGRPCVIICQNENGPCPLLAIANVLLLQGKISISSDISIIALAELTQIVANAILEKIGQSSLPEHVKLVESVLNILPKLARGLDLNVIFNGVNKFEFTEEISVFDALNIQLLHGWLCDPKDTETAAVVGNLSYNHLMFRLVEYKTLSMDRKPAESNKPEASVVASNSEREAKAPASDTNTSTSEKVETTRDINEIRREGAVIDKFLTDTAGQFTYPGMLALYNTMQDRQCAVFFRNNHFSTVFFVNGQLFILITDLGYLQEPSVVWEILDRIDGNSEFYNDTFEPLSSAQSPGFNQRHVQEFVIAAAGGTTSATLGGSRSPTSPTAGTICSPPRATSAAGATITGSPAIASKKEEQAVSAATTPATPSTDSGAEALAPAGALMSSAVLVGDHSEGTAEESSDVIVPTVTEPAAESSIEDSYEIVNHHNDEAEEEREVVPTIVPSTDPADIKTEQADQAAQAAPAPPELSAAVFVGDTAPIAATVTPPLPPNTVETATATAAAPATATASEETVPALSTATTESVVSGRGGLPECAAPLSSIDPDLLLAMQLQEQEDLLAARENPAPDPRYNSYCDAQGFRFQAPSHSASSSQPTASTGDYGSVQGALLSQEERDRDHALMLHYQEVHAAEEHRRRTAAQAASQNRQQQGRPVQRGKDKNCVIC